MGKKLNTEPDTFLDIKSLIKRIKNADIRVSAPKVYLWQTKSQEILEIATKTIRLKKHVFHFNATNQKERKISIT